MNEERVAELIESCNLRPSPETIFWGQPHSGWMWELRHSQSVPQEAGRGRCGSPGPAGGFQNPARQGSVLGQRAPSNRFFEIRVILTLFD